MELPKDRVLILAIFAALGCAVMGGLLFAFSNVVMTALSRQPPASGIRTMQAINVHILNPLFSLLFFGTAVASFVLALMAAMGRVPRSAAPFLFAASGLYLIGTFGVTVAFNVPLNNKLASLNPATAEAAKYWLIYVSEWLKWNHVRTIASITAGALLLWAIRLMPPKY